MRFVFPDAETKIWGSFLNMHNRLIQKLNESKKKKAKLFCAYVTLGFPSLKATARLVPMLERAGTDILELGFPFSDPLADGPTIQFSSSEAIKKGIKIQDAFQLVKSLRKKGLQMPVVFFSYLNPIMHYGISRFIRQLSQNGFDGLIVPDLPPEEGRMWDPWFRKFNISTVYLAAPTTSPKRLKKIVGHSNGFVYYVSLKGVTGARRRLPNDLFKRVQMIKKISRKPVLVGFGVSYPNQARAIARHSDGIIVGSAIVHQLAKRRGGEKAALSLVSNLIRSTKQR